MFHVQSLTSVRGPANLLLPEMLAPCWGLLVAASPQDRQRITGELARR